MCTVLAYCGKNGSEDSCREILEKALSRGPDMTRILPVGDGLLGFNRLSIMGLAESGMQPFVRGENALVCNGELYGFRPLKDYLASLGYSFQSGSDCEILLPLYERLGCSMFRLLDAEFALVLYDARKQVFIAARDPIGIRPLYYGRDAQGTVIFASEPKMLVGTCETILPFPPGHYAVLQAAPGTPRERASSKEAQARVQTGAPGRGAEDLTFTCYADPSRAETFSHDSMEQIAKNIHDRLLSGIRKRLDADAPVGFLLSGGLDSSLVCGAAAAWSDRPIETFSIGMDTDAIDLKYARQVADYIHSNHHEVIITNEDVLEALDPVIAALGTYDITTIRASIGMYLVCKWIHEHTGIRVVLTGEISDELFGYKYTDFAPDAEEFQKEAQKRIHEIHMYDVLRADRCISVHSLEARVPFGDLSFVDYVMRIDPEKKLNRYGIGKYLLRRAFEEDRLIPGSILMREKAAFSDAVGHSLADGIRARAEELYSDEDLERLSARYSHAKPFTKESLLYREIFEKHYPGQSQLVKDFWMPNRSWKGCDVNDPSARVLSNYGASGE